MKICCKSEFRNNTFPTLQYCPKISPLHFRGRAISKINTVWESNEIVNNACNERQNYTLGVGS